MLAEPVSCGECGAVGTKRVGAEADIVCTECGTLTNYIDYMMQLDDGESLEFIDGVLHVVRPAD